MLYIMPIFSRLLDSVFSHFAKLYTKVLILHKVKNLDIDFDYTRIKKVEVSIVNMRFKKVGIGLYCTRGK